MWQEAARRLLNRSYHFQVREVASLLAQPLKIRNTRNQCHAEEPRSGALFELQVLYALEIQPVTLRSIVLADHADQGVVARSAAHNGTYIAHVSHLGADLSRCAAADAGSPGRGDLQGEDFGQ